jgi:hypothetical protein
MSEAREDAPIPPIFPGGTPARLDDLAPAHQRALALDGAGATADDVAVALDIPVEAVPAVLRIARAKARGCRDHAAVAFPGDGEVPPPAPGDE